MEAGVEIREWHRIGALELPIGSARTLEDQVLPQADDVVACVRALTRSKLEEV